MTAESPQHFFWDSCVFYALLNDESYAYDVNSIRQFLEDAKEDGSCKIYTSGIVFTEVTPARLQPSKYGSFEEFLDDFRGQIVTLDADPIICSRAGDLRDIPYKKNGSTSRVLTTGDAIMLATALELKNTYGIEIDAFHTFDNGNGARGPEGKGVPLLTFEEWCEGLENNDLAQEVIGMNRCMPIHPSPKMAV